MCALNRVTAFLSEASRLLQRLLNFAHTLNRCHPMKNLHLSGEVFHLLDAFHVQCAHVPFTWRFQTSSLDVRSNAYVLR